MLNVTSSSPTANDRPPLVSAPPLVTLTSTDAAVVVLAEGHTDSAVNFARGHLFERFFADFLHSYGYNKPKVEDRNITRSGIELDLSATHNLTRQPAIVECKAQVDPIGPTQLGKFHSKLVVERYKSPKTHGFFVAIPRFTAPAREQADLIIANDPGFSVLTANGLADQLRQNGTIIDCPLPGILTSDYAVIISEAGIFGACLENDRATRIAKRLLVWSASHTPVPKIVLSLLEANSYSQGVPVTDARSPASDPSEASEDLDPDPDNYIVTVTGSDSDFEYQPPASAKFFIGRESLVGQLEDFLSSKRSVLILNARSGWGKSSLALKLEQLAIDQGGYALVIDSRTINSRRFPIEALRRAVQESVKLGIMTLPDSASWASLGSALQTVRSCEWHKKVPIVLFFDQFENVFRDEPLAEEFRNLALGVHEISNMIHVGFAWKTDNVGWIDNFPFHLLNEIRAVGVVPQIEHLSAQDITALLQRLEGELDHPLTHELSQQLREFSQGLPWLFKKVAAHILREVSSGVTQERLASEGLNVRGLFESDLADLSSKEVAALKKIAQSAPVPVNEVSESIDTAVILSLIHRRLIVEVGATLDTYSDIFRDYLNTDRIPVQDSYIIRQSPRSVSRLLREVVRDNGDSDIRSIARRLGTRENALFNLSRELRLLGVTVYEPNRVRLRAEIWNSSDRESELRHLVAEALRRHRAYLTFSNAIDRKNVLTLDEFASELPAAFPGVEIKASTWQTYARSFLLWFEYAGLAIRSGQAWMISPEGVEGKGQLLGGKPVRRMRTGFLHERPGPALALACSMAAAGSADVLSERSKARAVRALILLGAVTQDPNSSFVLMRTDLVNDGEPVPEVLREMMSVVPGVGAGLMLLSGNPAVAPEELGEAVRRSLGANWRSGTKITIGKNLRAWARCAGLKVEKVPRGRR